MQALCNPVTDDNTECDTITAQVKHLRAKYILTIIINQDEMCKRVTAGKREPICDLQSNKELANIACKVSPFMGY